MTGDGINVASPVGVPTVSDNTVTNAVGTAVHIVNANDRHGQALNGNSGSGQRAERRAVVVGHRDGELVAAVERERSLPVLSSGCNSLTVPPSVTLTLGAGTIIKGQSSGCCVPQRAGVAGGDGDGCEPGDVDVVA